MFEEQDSVCTMCGHRHKLTTHHKIRRSNGGSNETWNLVGICRPCHDRIHGFGAECTDGYPDYIAAGHASLAHWEVVRDSWTHAAMLAVYDHREKRKWRQREENGETVFGILLREALQEREPRCT